MHEVSSLHVFFEFSKFIGLPVYCRNLFIPKCCFPAQGAPLRMWEAAKNVDRILSSSDIIKLNQFISSIIPCGGKTTAGMLS